MAEFLEKWTKAKDEFEAATGLKKPAAKGKVLFVTFRKPSGLEDAFEEIDKYVDGCEKASSKKREMSDVLTADFFKKWEAAVARMERKQADYLPTLKKAIDAELDESGKSDRYRAFKTLKAELESNVSRAKMNFVNHFGEWKARKEAGEGATDHFERIARNLDSIGQALKAGTSKAALFCKKSLQNPDPLEYQRHDGICIAARDLAHYLKNLNRYVFTDFEKVFSLEDDNGLLADLDDPQIARRVTRMRTVLIDYSSFIRDMSILSGTTLFDASLSQLAHEPPRFEEGATADDVRLAVKHFAGMVKKVGEIADHLLRFAA